MSFRTRVTLAAAAAVAVAVALAAAGVYVAARGVLRGEVDRALEQRLTEVGRVVPALPPGEEAFVDRLALRLPDEPLGGAEGFIQIIAQRGAPRRPQGVELGPAPSARARRVAAGLSESFFEDVTVRGVHVRVLTAPLAPGLAIQIARPLDEVDDTLRRLAFVLAAFALGGVGLAAAMGWAVTQAALRPVRTLSEATAHVTSTGDLARRVDAPGRDELGRLAADFNTMLETLERSTDAQRQLVLDASHELRTPLTSLRTNLEVLARAKTLAEAERVRILDDVMIQVDELTTLMADVVELARGGELQDEVEDVRVDLLVEEAVERARRHAPDVLFDVETEQWTVRGVRRRLARAVANLLDNAAKWSPPGSTVEVRARAGEIVVRDHGPGIADEDLPHVFDRFYRARAARQLPGAGLGLAIVRDVAEAHGGEVTAERADDGGAVLRLQLLRSS